MIKRYIILLLILFAVTPVITAQTISKEIVTAFEKGDAKKLSKHLHKNLEIKLLDNIQMVSKNQATRLLQEFFDKHPPSSFTITYEGTKQGSKYGIGKLQSKDSTYRVNVYFMNQENENLIYILTIEKV